MPHKDLEARKQYHREYHRKHRVRRIAYAEIYRNTHKKERREYDRLRLADPIIYAKTLKQHNSWRRDNPDRAYAWNKANPERHVEYVKNWQKKNKGKCVAIVRKRQIRKIHATPDWLTAKQHKQIELKYEEVAELNRAGSVVYEVDHIVPLRGTYVCGLHVPWNLQVITQAENRAKWNKFDG